MGQPAARLTDLHVCPMLTPGLPPIPHVGGPITGPGCATVLISGLPAAVMGDMCVCVGPPDTIILGSTGVFFGGKPAARMGDSCAHGGTIVLGCLTVLIGESAAGAGGGLSELPAQTVQNMVQANNAAVANNPGQALPPLVAQQLAVVAVMQQAAANGAAFAQTPDQCGKCG